MLKRLLVLLLLLVVGPAIAQAPPTHIENVVVSEGDSISVYWAGGHPGIYDSARPAITVCGNAVGGSGIGTVVSRIQQLSDCNGEVVTLLIGANDLYTSSRTEQQWLAEVYNSADGLRAQGYKVALSTVLPRCDQTAAWRTEFNRRRAVVNPLIRASVGVHADAIIDYAADPVMGPDSAACNTALYRDGLHPTDGNAAGTGGQNKLAVIYTPVVDRLLAQ